MNDTSQPDLSALTVIDKARAVLKFDETKARLTALAEKSVRIVEITNAAGYMECHSARMDLKNERIAIESAGKEAREDAVAFQKSVIKVEAELVALIKPEEERLQKIQKAEDDRKEAEKKAKIEAERKRVADLQEGVALIRTWVFECAGKSCEVIEDAIKTVVAMEFPEATWQEFIADATRARDETLAKLRKMFAEREAFDADVKRLAEEQAEAERQRQADEKADRERREREDREAAERRRQEDEAAQAERERLAKEAAERHRQWEADQAAQAARQREADQAAATARAEADRAAEAERARLLAETEAALEKRRQELAEQEKAAEERRQAEQAIIEKAARNLAERATQAMLAELENLTLIDAGLDVWTLLLERNLVNDPRALRFRFVLERESAVSLQADL